MYRLSPFPDMQEHLAVLYTYAGYGDLECFFPVLFFKNSLEVTDN